MGCRKFILLNVVAAGVAFLLLAFSPYFLVINPQSYSVNLPEKFEKGLAYNERLSSAELLLENKIFGPESLALHKGAIYTGLMNGLVVKIQDGKSSVVAEIGEPGQSRPLGLRFDKKGLLYIADAFQGLLTLDINTGKVTNLLAHGTEINGKKLRFADDLDIDENGVVYLSDATTRWELHTFIYSMLEHDNSGRVLAHDTKTGKTSVLMDNLEFANGVQLTHDGKALLVAECFGMKILKYHLQGPKKGQREVFATLPGEIDNIRPSKSGGYWVAFFTARNTTAKTVLDHLSENPLIRKVIGRLMYTAGSALEYVSTFWPSPDLAEFAGHIKFGTFLLPLVQKSGLVVELNNKGEVIQSLHSSDPRLNSLSEILEDDGHLYLGSFINPYLGKVKL